jgi:hypothetical protein
MTADTTGQARRQMIASGQPAADLAADDGQKWDTEALMRDFDVIGFAAPFAAVRRRSDGQRGLLEFTTTRRSTSAGGPTMTKPQSTCAVRR